MPSMAIGERHNDKEVGRTMSVLTIIALVFTAWCAVAVVVAGLFSLAMRRMPDDPVVPARPAALRDVSAEAA
jgi:hypothetical protein